MWVRQRMHEEDEEGKDAAERGDEREISGRLGGEEGVCGGRRTVKVVEIKGGEERGGGRSRHWERTTEVENRKNQAKRKRENKNTNNRGYRTDHLNYLVGGGRKAKDKESGWKMVTQR